MTATVPHEVPMDLQPDSDPKPRGWIYYQTSLFHKGKEISTNLPNLNVLKPHQTVGFLLTTDGDLHVYHDGRHTKKVATNLPVNHRLWGAVDIIICNAAYKTYGLPT